MTPSHPLQVTMEVAASLTSIPMGTLREMAADGRVLTTKTGKRRYVLWSEIERLTTPVAAGNARSIPGHIAGVVAGSASSSDENSKQNQLVD